MAFFFNLDYIAECVDTFLTEQGLEDQETELNLGYTFSFPVLQSKVLFFYTYINLTSVTKKKSFIR